MRHRHSLTSGCADFGCADLDDVLGSAWDAAFVEGESFRVALLRSQMMRRPSSVRKSSTFLMYFEPVPIIVAKATGGDHVRVRAQLREQKFENAVHQAEISVVEAGLQAADRVGADHAGGLADFDAR